MTDVAFGIPDRSPDEVTGYLGRLAGRLGLAPAGTAGSDSVPAGTTGSDSAAAGTAGSDSAPAGTAGSEPVPAA